MAIGLAAASLSWAARAQDDDAPKIVCFASDGQVATGETILCVRGERSFYESLENLYRSGWVLKAKIRIRNQRAHAFYLERG